MTHQPSPGKKAPIKKKDYCRLRELYDLVRSHNNMDPDVQVYDLKNHAIRVGNFRRQDYEVNKIWDAEYEEEEYLED